jgi:hypothetical protein
MVPGKRAPSHSSLGDNNVNRVGPGECRGRRHTSRFSVAWVKELRADASVLLPVAGAAEDYEICPRGLAVTAVRHVVVSFEAPQLRASAKHEATTRANDSAVCGVRQYAYGCITPSWGKKSLKRIDVGEPAGKTALHLQMCWRKAFAASN